MLKQRNELSFLVMACCTETAYNYRKLILPYADQHILEKNKIRDAQYIFSSDLGWVWGHMHVVLNTAHGQKVHDLIVHRKHDIIDLHDSFINHRDISKRSYSVQDLYKMWHTFTNLEENIMLRKFCYDNMFDSPLGYTDAWDGSFECWLVRLS